MDKLNQLLADATELLKLPPEQMVRVIRERELTKAKEIAQLAVIADAKAQQPSGKWFASQKRYEAALFSGNHKKDESRAVSNFAIADAKYTRGKWWASQKNYEKSLIKQSAEPLSKR